MLQKDNCGFISNMDGHKALLSAEYDLFAAELGKPLLHKVAMPYYMFFPFVRGLYIRDFNKSPFDLSNADMFDNGFGLCSRSICIAQYIAKYGYTYFFHYDLRSFEQNKQLIDNITIFKKKIILTGFWAALYQHIQRTRQPYQIAAYSLMGYGFCDPISYLHLLIVICIEPFKSGTSGKKLLFLFMKRARYTGKPLAWLYNYLMKTFYDKKWVSKVYTKYYKDTCCELAALAIEYDNK